MSSLTRRLQKKRLKKLGYHRDRQETLHVLGLMDQPMASPTFGHILNREGDSVGIHYPRVSPRQNEDGQS